MKKILLLFQINHSVRWALQGGHYNLIPNRHWNVRASAPVATSYCFKVHSHREKAKTKCIQKNTNIHFFWKWHPQALATCLLSLSVTEPLDLLILPSTFSDFPHFGRNLVACFWKDLLPEYNWFHWLFIHPLFVCSFLQSEDSANFSLVEVLLDKGVTEREMASDEKPWQILIDKRMVRNLIIYSHYSVADPGFSWGGGANSWGGCANLLVC